jgi:hypothetical protein
MQKIESSVKSAKEIVMEYAQATERRDYIDIYYGLTALIDWRPIICNENTLSFCHR